jgi:hypothetical protein
LQALIILGPILVGLYWRTRRPKSSFGPLLIMVGLLAIPVSLEASSHAWPHTVGVVAEAPLLFATFAVILAFPTGKLEGLAERAILGVLLIVYFVWLIPFWLLSSELVGSQLNTCTGSCPRTRSALRHTRVPSAMESGVRHRLDRNRGCDGSVDRCSPRD